MVLAIHLYMLLKPEYKIAFNSNENDNFYFLNRKIYNIWKLNNNERQIYKLKFLVERI